jgi:hypothetical protein
MEYIAICKIGETYYAPVHFVKKAPLEGGTESIKINLEHLDQSIEKVKKTAEFLSDKNNMWFLEMQVLNLSDYRCVVKNSSARWDFCEKIDISLLFGIMQKSNPHNMRLEIMVERK